MITFAPLSVPYAPADAAGRSSVRTKLDPDGEEQEQPKALAYLLQMDDVRVLIDCGSPEDFLFSGISQLPSPEKADQNDKTSSGSTDDKSPESSSMAQERDHNEAPKPHLGLDMLKAAPLDTLLKELAPTIDLCLLSHSSLDHLGLYAYAHAKLGLRSLVYATMPVQSMGKLTVLEAIQAWRSEVDIDQETKQSMSSDDLPRRCLPTLDEVEDAFEDIKVVRYMQPTHLEGKCASLTLTAYNAGHSLGGAIWKIRSPTSGTVVIALDWNHNRERHLDGTILLSSSATSGAAGTGSGAGSDAVRRPDLLITEVERGLVVNTRRKDRDAAMLDLVHKTIQAGHSVFLPVDASARLLELLVLLDQHWAFAYPHAKFPLCLISKTGKEVMERSRTYMEWMTREWATKASETIESDKDHKSANAASSKGGQQHRGRMNKAGPSSPLDFKYVKVFASLQAMDEAVPQDQAKVVMAVPPSMTHGPSRRLLSRFAQNPDDVILLTSRGEPGSLCRQLWEAWNTNQQKGFSWTKGQLGATVSPGTRLEFDLKSKVPLEGEELRAHLEAEQAERDRLAQQRALLARSRRRLEADEDDESESDSDSEAEDAEEMYDVATKAEGGGEAGSMVRKRPHGVAFAESGNVAGGVNADLAMSGGADTNQLSFDIYLKGNASRATSFFGSKAGQEGPFGLGVRYRLFPVVERKRRVDGYGEVIDVGRWLSRRRQVEAAEAADSTEKDGAAHGNDAKKKKQSEPEQKAVPSKYITEHISVNVSCKVAFIELTGLNDGRALKTLIPQLHPRRLIMVNGDEATRKDMQLALSAIKSLTKEMFTPTWMQVIQIGEMTNSFTVNLGEGLLAALNMSRFEDYEVGHIRASVRFGVDGSSSIPTLETWDQQPSLDEEEADAGAGKSVDDTIVKLASSGILRSRLASAVADDAQENDRDGESMDAMRIPEGSVATQLIVPMRSSQAVERTATSLSLANKESDETNNSASGISVPPTLFIGDLKLSSLKTALGGPPYRLGAEFAGEGMLVCAPSAGSEAVIIQKESKGKIVIEGNVTRSFKNVRKAVYAMHARVAGQQE